MHTPHTFSNALIGQFIYKSHFLNMSFSASGYVGFVCFHSFCAFKRNTKGGVAVNQINTPVSIFVFLAALLLPRNISFYNVSHCVPNCIYNYMTRISIFVNANASERTSTTGFREAAGPRLSTASGRSLQVGTSILFHTVWPTEHTRFCKCIWGTWVMILFVLLFIQIML